MSVTAIIVAAGSGLRSGSAIPKQFVEIKHRPLILYTVDKFLAAPRISDLIIVAAADRIDFLCRTLSGVSKPVSVVEGGKTRAESVFNGISSLSRQTEAVAIHDAARPFVKVEDIEATISKALETGAACLVAEVPDTIKTVFAGEISGTLDRSRIRRALTPQTFRTEVIRRAFELADLSEPVPDDAYLVEKLGHPITAVEASSENMKITYPADLELARIMIEAGL